MTLGRQLTVLFSSTHRVQRVRETLCTIIGQTEVEELPQLGQTKALQTPVGRKIPLQATLGVYNDAR
jgi:hypothetical protein